MSKSFKTLLPNGLYDLLPSEAWFCRNLVNTALGTFEKFGYEQVSPPLVEFEESLLAGPGKSMRGKTFRMMDPLSLKMLGIRADMTMQIARIALGRLAKAAKPLRLSYAGEVLRTKGSGTGQDRQLTQVGVELIGVTGPEADAEAILVAVEALETAGIQNLSVDLNFPSFVKAFIEQFDLPYEKEKKLLRAISRKDLDALDFAGVKEKRIYEQMLHSAGHWEDAFARLKKLDLSKEAVTLLRALENVCELVAEAKPKLNITVDVAENRGFEYHTGISFSFFAENVNSELGRGGRYQIQSGRRTMEGTGFTLYINTIFRALPVPKGKPRVLVPKNTLHKTCQDLHAQGFITVRTLEDGGDSKEQAKLLRCTHIYNGRKAVPVE